MLRYKSLNFYYKYNAQKNNNGERIGWRLEDRKPQKQLRSRGSSDANGRSQSEPEDVYT